MGYILRGVTEEQWLSLSAVFVEGKAGFKYMTKTAGPDGTSVSFYCSEDEWLEEVDADLFIRTNGTCEKPNTKQMMRTNIKMRVTSEQYAAAIEILMAAGFTQGLEEFDPNLEIWLYIYNVTKYARFSDSIDNLGFEEVDADLFIRTNGHCYQDGDVVTLGDKVSEKFQGLTGTLSNVDGDAAILNYGGEKGLAIRLNWIDRDAKVLPETKETIEQRLKEVELHVMGQKEPTLLQIPEDILEYARSLPDEELEGIEATLNERGQRYGDFDKHAQITQDLKAVMVNTPNWQTLTPSAKEALEMIAHKIGRILNGDPTYADSWHDIAGYSTLVEKECDHD